MKRILRLNFFTTLLAILFIVGFSSCWKNKDSAKLDLNFSLAWNGNNVSIGGQAGISGHLKIGNNVKIGGGSGVVKDIDDNQIVMGYPAVPLKEFLKNSKK